MSPCPLLYPLVVFMSDPDPSVLKRKAAFARVQPDFGVISPAKALRLGVSKAAQDVLKVPLVATEVTEGRLTLPDFEPHLPHGSLSLLLQGPGSARGLVSLDAGALAAVIQAQTLGRILGYPVQPRVPTATDAMLARKFITLFLTAFKAALADHPAAVWADGYATRDRVEDIRRLPHLLADVAYRLYSIKLDIGAEGRGGTLSLVLPCQRGGEDGEALLTSDGGDAEWRASLGNLVMDSPAQLEAVLYRFRLTLSEVARLGPGTLLALPARALANVALEGEMGERTGTGRLGQIEGCRALKLSGLDFAAEGADGAAKDFQSAASRGLTGPHPEPVSVSEALASIQPETRIVQVAEEARREV